MINKIKLAIVALLGFSTACSSVKHTTRSKTDTQSEEVTPAIKVMYGVPAPRPVDRNHKHPRQRVQADNPRCRMTEMSGGKSHYNVCRRSFYTHRTGLMPTLPYKTCKSV